MNQTKLIMRKYLIAKAGYSALDLTKDDLSSRGSSKLTEKLHPSRTRAAGRRSKVWQPPKKKA